MTSLLHSLTRVRPASTGAPITSPVGVPVPAGRSLPRPAGTILTWVMYALAQAYVLTVVAVVVT